jgi:hypothetical protein
MGKDAAVGGVLGILSQSIVPFKGRRRVVGSVDIVVVDNRVL